MFSTKKGYETEFTDWEANPGRDISIPIRYSFFIFTLIFPENSNQWKYVKSN